MLRKLLLSSILICSPAITWGQALSVTATLTDSDSVVWVNGTCSATLYSPNGTAYYNGTAIPTGPIACTINGSGVLSATLYNTSTAAPTGVQYQMQICSATSAACSSFLTPITAANQTSNLSSLITAPRFIDSPTAYGYSDLEAKPAAPYGTTYYNTTTPAWRQWNGSARTTVGSGGGGSVSITAGSSALTVSPSPITGTGTVDLNLAHANTFTTSLGAMWLSSNGALQIVVPSQASMDYCVSGCGSGLGVGMRLISVGATGTIGDFAAIGLNGASGGFTEYISCTHNSNICTMNSLNSLSNIQINSADVPAMDTNSPTASQAACIKSAGPPISLGTCSTVVGAGGACTCT